MRITFRLISCILFSSLCINSQNLTIHHIDVGQGDATFIQVANGKNLLLDAGDRGKGSNMVLPYLKALGITSIDYLVASHYHSDHIGGSNEVIEGLSPDSIRAIYDRGFRDPLPSSKVFAIYRSLAERNPLHTAVNPGQVIHLSENVILQCFASDGLLFKRDTQTAPSRKEESGNMMDENDRSLVWVLTYTRKNAHRTSTFRYFTGGDWSDPENTSLVTGIGDVDAMKVSHHGSASATNHSLVDILEPEAAVISVGDGNRYGHPRQECLDCLQNATSVRYIYQTEKGAGGWTPKVRGVGNVVISVFDGYYVVAKDTFWLKADTVYGFNGVPAETGHDSTSRAKVNAEDGNEESFVQIDVDDSGPATFSLSNILGHVLWIRPLQCPFSSPFRLDLHSLHLPPGIYFLNLQTSSQQSVKKIIVLR